MSRFLSSFYAKISAVFLALLLVLSAAYLSVVFRSALRLIDEVEQKLYAGYAEHIAAELQPLVSGGLQVSNIKQAIHYMMVADPRVEIYLLDNQGTILAFFSESQQPLTTNRVNLSPVMRFIADRGRHLTLGPDPRVPGAERPFSAAPLEIAGKRSGYVYVVLGGQEFASTFAMLRQSYFVRIGSISIVLILVVAGLAGLALFALLTRRLRGLAEAVDAFEGGELSRRVATRSADEIDRLGQSFNRMADTIGADIERMKAIDLLRRELVANVSHDLRSPLASIRGYLETTIMHVDSLSKEELRGYLDVTLRNTLTLEKLVGELFDLSKLETSNYQPAFEPVHLAEVMQDITMKLGPQAERKHVTLSTSLPAGLPAVTADIALIDRAMTNLIENAIRYTDSGGSVETRLEASEGGVRVTVADTGRGISRDDLPFIFDRFYRAERSRGRDLESTGTGAGLGLAIVKRIVELHESEIIVRSELDRGTSFSFRLAAVQAGGAAPNDRGA